MKYYVTYKTTRRSNAKRWTFCQTENAKEAIEYACVIPSNYIAEIYDEEWNKVGERRFSIFDKSADMYLGQTYSTYDWAKKVVDRMLSENKAINRFNFTIAKTIDTNKETRKEYITEAIW